MEQPMIELIEIATMNPANGSLSVPCPTIDEEDHAATTSTTSQAKVMSTTTRNPPTTATTLRRVPTSSPSSDPRPNRARVFGQGGNL